ncbi:ABC transporter substrate-binding protein [Rugosimonospora africana]|uniref:Branched-chain amino acid ABC transporter substrate-binding protein n=1 Tax=Rugosimonospora africana TaxID=556532 RepID=A0A8J3VNC7_9ACTN|nr:ABC transporter substrate-binding protein [Rugosimonospora africana]GIH13089.1 branched-chain amino acid ABC transporter substrate-binding protein [Rugosimonospora africana]
MTQLARRDLLRLIAAAGAAGVTAPMLAACDSGSSTAANTAPVRVGLLVPQSGPNKAIGDELANGFNLYLSLNGNKLGSHPVTLTVADEGAGGDVAKSAADKLVKQAGVQVMTGVAAASTMSALRDQIEKAQVPLLGTNGSPLELSSPKYIWRTCYVDNEPGQSLGQYIGQNVPGNQKVFVISDDSPSARDEVNGFVGAYQDASGQLELAADPLVVPLHSKPDTSLTQAMQQIKESGANTVFAYFADPGAVAFIKAFHDRLSGVTLYCPGFMTETALLTEQKSSANGVYTSLNYSPDLDNDANQLFAAQYRKAYDRDPSTYAMASYDAGGVLASALQLAGGDLSPQSINAAIAQIGEIDSPRGTWQFNQNRTPLQTWYLRQVRPDGAVLSNVLLSDLATLT